MQFRNWNVSPLVSPTDDNPVFHVDASGVQAGTDIEHAVDQVGMNAVGSLLENPSERTLDTAIYVDDNFGRGAVGGIFHEGETTAAGRYTVVSSHDGPIKDDTHENGATGGFDYDTHENGATGGFDYCKQ